MSEHYCPLCPYQSDDTSNYNKHLKTKKHKNNQSAQLSLFKAIDKTHYHPDNVIPYSLDSNPYLKVEYKTKVDNNQFIRKLLIRDFFDPVLVAEDLFAIFSTWHQLDQGYRFPLMRTKKEQSPWADLIMGMYQYELAEIQKDKVVFTPYHGELCNH